MRDYVPAWLLFASDATVVALCGAGCLLMAFVALLLERRRHRRDRIGAADKVGWVPWTTIFLLFAVIGMGLVAASLPGLAQS